MSRHRLVRQLDLSDELDDEPIDSGGVDEWDNLTEEQQYQMDEGLAAVQSTLGPDTDFSDRDMKEALWNYYFVAEDAIGYLLEEQHKAAKRKQASESTIARVEAAPSQTAAEVDVQASKLQKLDLGDFTSRAADPISRAAKPGKPLSKLQQRIQAKQAVSRAGSGAPAVSTPKPEPKVEPAWTLPESQLFAQTIATASPSAFASTALPSARKRSVLLPDLSLAPTPSFDTPSPDDVVLKARQGTSLAPARRPRAPSRAVLTRPCAEQAAAKKKSGGSVPSTPGLGSKKRLGGSVASTPSSSRTPSQAGTSRLQEDLAGLGLTPTEPEQPEVALPPPPPREDILKELERRLTTEKPTLSLVVVGHVDAGKSTLMGRLLIELGEVTDKAAQANQRNSEKMGKGSFAFAWQFDALAEERERGVTIDVAVDSFQTEHRQFTLIDAPGHRDFVPNMISGASQADTAVLVIDASLGAFEAGFGENGQTREHAMLVRSLGVQQVVVAVNKLDAVGWSQDRFLGMVDQLRPFLLATGFAESKLSFVPVGAFTGENLLARSTPELRAWYNGRTLVATLDALSVPARAVTAPLRLPISNVFRSGSGVSGHGVSGRIESGIIAVGDKLRVLPGDESATVRTIEIDADRHSWASAGQNVTVYLNDIDPIYLSVGCVLCPPSQLVPLAAVFSAQIVVFDVKVPITAGTSIELYHHSKNTPAVVSKLEALLDKANGTVLKANPRMLQRNTSARIQISIRAPPSSTGRRATVPLEPFTTNKSMGRVLVRRGGETIAAGVVLAILEP